MVEPRTVNTRVFQDYGFNNTQNSVSQTIPRVIIGDFPVKIAGSLAYDIVTETVWYSDGIAWLPINPGSSGAIVEEITIYANAETGSDSNSGLSSGTAVRTIQKALDVLSTYFAHRGIVQLQGSVAFDLGTDGELNFFAATTFIGSITIRGTMSDIIEDTVASIPTPSGIGPFDTWTVVNGTTGGYTPSEYIGSFIRNDTQNRVYVVSDNSASSVDTMTGTQYLAPNGKGAGWVVGDSFTMFKVQNILSYAGTMKIINPSNSIIFFEYLWIQPAVGGSWMNAELPITTYRGCRMDSNSTASYVGSMYLEGGYSENTSIPTVFTGIEQYSSKRLDSVWLNGPTARFNNICSVFFFNSTNGLDIENAAVIESSDFQGFSFQILNSLGQRVLQIRNASMFTMTAVSAENSPLVSGTQRVLDVSGISIVTINGLRLRGNSVVATPITAGFACELILGNEDNPDLPNFGVYVAGTSTTYTSFGGSTLSILGGNVYIRTTQPDRTVYVSDGDSSCNILVRDGDVHTYEQLGGVGASPLITVQLGSIFTVHREGGTVNFLANSTGATFNIVQSKLAIVSKNPGVGAVNITNLAANAPGMLITRGSRYDSLTSGGASPIAYSTRQTSNSNATVELQTNSSFTSNDPLTDSTATRILLCGNVPVIAGAGPYSTSINDYTLVPRQNCAATFG